MVVAVDLKRRSELPLSIPTRIMSKKVSAVVYIANPEGLHGKEYTSGKNAARLVRQGRAGFLSDGTLYVNDGLPNSERDSGAFFRWRNRESGHSLGRNGMTVKQAERLTPA